MRRLLAALLIVASPAGAQLNIGVAAAVRGPVKAVAPGAAAGRVVETGKPVYSHDKVTTGPDGKLQILLLDQTSFTVGPNSQMELDEFVFDPATNAGTVSATISKGSFRFVTGKVARKDPASMKVKTPVGTIGIRGTMTAGSVSDTEGTFVLLGPGPENNADEKAGGITVKNDKGSSEVDKDGWGVTVKAGEPPSEPYQLPPGQLDGILNGVGSNPKSGGEEKTASGGDSSSGKDADSDGSAGAASGQETAKGGDNASDAFAALDASQPETSQFAAQQRNAPHATTWEDVIAIPGGTGKYSGTGNYYDCTGGTCGTSALGTTTFSMLVDFGAKTMGGGGSESQIALTSPAGVTHNINSFSYAGFSGDAVVDMAPNMAGSNWAGTTLKVNSVGGVTAGAVSVDVRWDTGFGTKYGGPVTATLGEVGGGGPGP